MFSAAASVRLVKESEKRGKNRAKRITVVLNQALLYKSNVGSAMRSTAGQKASQSLMKTLFLLRHAKSSWDFPELKDFERPLSDRGNRDIPVMGERLRERAHAVDCIISSPAVRANTTARKMAEAIGYPVEEVSSNPELYFAGTGMFLKAASLMDDGCHSLMLVGHNPAITEFANAMTGENIENIPTCGLVQMSLPIDQWSAIELGCASLVDFDYPKKQH